MSRTGTQTLSTAPLYYKELSLVSGGHAPRVAKIAFASLTLQLLMVCVQPAIGQHASVAFHLPHDLKITPDKAAREQLRELRLADVPVLTSDDILFYDHRKCRLYVTSDSALAVVRALGTAYGKSRATRPRRYASEGTIIPVVVMAGGERQFLAALYGEDILFYEPWPALGPTTKPALRHSGEPYWGGSLPTRVVTLDLLIPWGQPGNADPRDGQAFLDAMRDTGRLDPATLTKPRMTPEEASAIARQTNTHWPQIQYGGMRREQPIPEDWRVRTVVFCIDVVVTIPSPNIIGLEQEPPLHCMWAVQFVPPEPDTASTTQPGRVRRVGGDMFQERVRSEEWCLVDDVTGRTLSINRPLYAKLLTATGEEELIVGPIATHEEIRAVAGEHHVQVDEMVFLDSIEVFPLTASGARSSFWVPVCRAWLCRGKDASGVARALLVTDRIQGYRGPELCLDAEFEMRRAIPAKQ